MPLIDHAGQFSDGRPIPGRPFSFGLPWIEEPADHRRFLKAMGHNNNAAETLDPSLPESTLRRAEEVLRLADDGDMRLATAESCTGGLLAALLTDVPGRSHVFERGFVVYSDEAKCDLLEIARDKVESCGAVSQDIAVEMARGALRNSRAHVAVSITGFAGHTKEGEEGLVHFACARNNGETCHREEHFGAVGRQAVRIAALDVALAMFDDALRGQTDA